MILIKGMVTAMKSVTYVFALLILFTYVFAIAFTQLAVGTESAGDVFHANISHSMYALLIHLTFLDDLSAYMEVIRYEIWPLIILSLIFIGLAALTLMNMLIGVLCEIVSAVAESERADMRAETLANNMTRIMKELDENRNGLICLHEFTNIVQNKDAINLFGEVGVDPLSIIDFAELFFYDDEGKEIELEFEGLMEVILDLRESNEATVKDMLNFWMKCKITTNADLSKAKKEFETLKGETDERFASMSAAQSRVNEQIAKIAQDLQRLSGNAPVAESAGG
jgi:chaperonin cofactor prefoldin